jgi:hypothetical protein
MRPFLLFFLMIFFSASVIAQNNENSLEGVPFNERIVTGGGMGLSFGSNQDFISLSPIIGYAITKKFVVGTGLTYQYTKYKDVYPGTDVTTSNYGINPFMRYTIYRGIFVHTEYEYLNYEGILPNLETQRLNFDSFMAGGGIMQPIGDRAGIFFMALYNFSYRDPRQGEFLPYASPWVIRAGINVGALSF